MAPLSSKDFEVLINQGGIELVLMHWLHFRAFIDSKLLNKNYPAKHPHPGRCSAISTGSITDLLKWFSPINKSPTSCIAGGMMKPPRRGHCVRKAPKGAIKNLIF
ncbi:MAG: hypothetical protein SRB2_02949 [Desulfobacteraceae bacterium Eth-SRB2]|nr:MAG: hypothetical protein SRB2_02949 [Desulfobacteraceae bacterium Eth-SRB2]